MARAGPQPERAGHLPRTPEDPAWPGKTPPQGEDQSGRPDPPTEHTREGTLLAELPPHPPSLHLTFRPAGVQ